MNCKIVKSKLLIKNEHELIFDLPLNKLKKVTLKYKFMKKINFILNQPKY